MQYTGRLSLLRGRQCHLVLQLVAWPVVAAALVSCGFGQSSGGGDGYFQTGPEVVTGGDVATPEVALITTVPGSTAAVEDGAVQMLPQGTPPTEPGMGQTSSAVGSMPTSRPTTPEAPDSPLGLDELPRPLVAVDGLGAKGGGVHVLIDDVLRPPKEADTFEHFGVTEDVIASNPAATERFGVGPAIGRLLKGDSDEVYWIENRLRRHVPSMDALAAAGLGASDIDVVSDRFLRRFAMGTPFGAGTTSAPPSWEYSVDAELVAKTCRNPLVPYLTPDEICVVHADGHDPRFVTWSTHPHASSTSPAWHPEVPMLALQHCFAGSTCHIVVFDPSERESMSLDNEDLAILDHVLATSPRWSPDGTQLAYNAGDNSVYLWDLEAEGDIAIATGVSPVGWSTAGVLLAQSGPGVVVEILEDGVGPPVSPDTEYYDQRYYPWVVRTLADLYQEQAQETYR